jgi:hypothetical protein
LCVSCLAVRPYRHLLQLMSYRYISIMMSEPPIELALDVELGIVEI